MPSISMTKTLQISHRRADVAALWIVVVTTVSILVCLGSFALGADLWWAYGLLAGPMILLPQVFQKTWFDSGVVRWNRNTSRLARVLTAIAMRLYFFLIFVSASTAGSRLRTAPPKPGESLWTDCDTGSSDMDLLESGQAGRTRWLLDMVKFARRSGNGWMVILVPFFLALMLLGDEEEDTTPATTTYTLY